MTTNADERPLHELSPENTRLQPVDETLAREVHATPEPEEPAIPAELSGNALLRKGLVRWATAGLLRVLYRRWTRIAVYAFPEGSARARLATHIGIPLPDRLNMNWITPHLAVGGRIMPQDIERLSRAGVSRVVDTRSEHQDDAEALGRAGIELLYLPTPDTYPLTVDQLLAGARWVNEQIADGHRVLIHCEHGVGRSVLLTAAAMVAGGMSARDAITLIQRKRWQAAPNHRQMRQLQEFERAIRSRERTKAS